MPTSASNRPRRKAKQARARQTLEVILEAAARVLLDRGYGGATTNRISEAAGVSVGTVYEYFANKEDVFEALIQREVGVLVRALQGQPPRPGASIVETLTGIIGAGMAAMRHGPELYRSLEQVPGARFRRQLAAARREVVAFVRRLLEVHRAELRVSDLDLAAFVIVGAVEGVAANASRELLDARLACELTELLEGYLVGSARAGEYALPNG
jgi:AcrR family transcriptional regulator